MNTSGLHSVENLKMRVVVQRISSDPEQAAKEKPKEELLMNDAIIKTLPAKQQMGFIFIFKVDFQANYFLIVDMEYTSQLFTEQLKRAIGSHPDID